MFTALSGVSLNDLQPSTGTGPQSNTPGVNAPKQVPVPVSQTDTVKLSVTQQVRNLHSEGEGPGQIANSLGLTSTQVNGDLYVSLTWPQLLSKVASSSLGLASTPFNADAPDSEATAPAAAIFPKAKIATEPGAVVTSGTKNASVPAADVFSKDTVLPDAKDTSLSADAFVRASRVASAA